MKTAVHHLANGATLLVTPVAEAQSVTLFVTVPHGSRHETPAQAGLAHFFEHMVFKGGKKYPTPDAISHALDQYGAIYNAFTDNEQTGYYAKIATAHFDTALDVISDYLTNAALREEDINRERGVILEEYKMYWDVPESRAEQQIGPLVFGQTNLGREIIGDPAVIKKVTRKDFLDWQKSYYGADRVVISVAGGVPPKLEEKIKAAFSALPAKTPVVMTPPELITQGPTVLMDARPGEQTQLVMGWPGLKAQDRRLWIQKVLQTIMGVSMSSRLFSELREKRGLCYTIRMGGQSFSDTGIIDVTAGLDKDRLPEALEAIWAELKKISQTPPPAAELTKAKEFIKGSTILTLEDSTSVAHLRANQWLFEGKIDSLEERFAKIEAVTKDEVRDLAAELFTADKLGLVLVGPKQNTDKLIKILK